MQTEIQIENSRSNNPSHEEPTKQWRLVILLCTAQFLGVLTLQIVSVALPLIQQQLKISANNLQWVMTAYSLTFGGFLLLGGRLGDWWGRRRVFMLGLGLYGLASLGCGLAWADFVLIVARAFQGLGAALFTASAFSLLTTAFKEGRERNRALGLWGIAAPLGGFTGLAVGGFLINSFGWAWAFLITVPIAGLACWLTPSWLDKALDQTTGVRLDLAGALTGTLGLIALVYGFSQIGQTNFNALLIVAALISAVVLLVAFIVIERRAANPLLDFAFFRRRWLLGANLVILLQSGISNSPIYFYTLYMQQIKGASAFVAGLAFLPANLTIIIGSALGVRLSNRLGYRFTLLAGLTGLGVAMLLFMLMSTNGNYWVEILPGLLGLGLSLGVVSVGANVAGTSGLANKEQSLATGLINTSVQIGSALILALLTTIANFRTSQLTQTTPPEPNALVDGFRWAFAGSAFLAILSIVIAWRLIPRAIAKS